MGKSKIYRLFTAVALYLVLPLAGAGCVSTKQVASKPQLRIIPEPVNMVVDLEQEPAVVGVEYAVEIPEGYTQSRGQIILQPVLTDGVNSTPLTAVYINGTKFEQREQRAGQSGKGAVTDYSQSIKTVDDGSGELVGVLDVVPFEDWMALADVVVKMSYRERDRTTYLYDRSVGGDIVFLLPPVDNPEPEVVAEVVELGNVREDDPVEKIFDFTYAIGSSSLDAEYDNNGMQIAGLNRLLSTLQAGDLLLDNIKITGYSSPDGPYEANHRLAGLRAEAVKSYIVNNSNIDPYIMEVEVVDEDWRGLNELIMYFDIEHQQKILDIIEGHATPQQKEAQLKAMPEQYKFIKDNYLPRLRRTTCRIYLN